ncbi:MAG: rRNA intron-encoded endonuclease [Candidatus Bathyarchaeota archaeon B24]|nr:MAG: rRNA intron-encoded endonuclease [Candidatus Bathyarchaeota archaeon B24]
MPCRMTSDVHEWINEGPAVPTRDPVKLPGGEKSTVPQRGEKSPWSFTAACCWGMAVDA